MAEETQKKKTGENRNIIIIIVITMINNSHVTLLHIKSEINGLVPNYIAKIFTSLATNGYKLRQPLNAIIFSMYFYQL